MTHHRLRRLVGATVATVVAAVGITMAGAGAASAATTLPTDAVNGVFAGPCAADAVHDFSAWRGTQATVAMDALDWRSWGALTDASWMGHCWAGTGIDLTLAVPMFPTSGATLAEGAAGSYDSHFTDLATSLVAHGLSHATLRLGWEFNGSWQPWAAAGHEADYVSYYRRIVTAMRAVPGAAFSFNWNLAVGWNAIDAATAYPGDDVVDSVGMNVYDQSWLPGTFPYPTGATLAQRQAAEATAWAGTVGGDFGMDHWAAFAAAHHKPISIPEWGIVQSDATSAGGDDPVFVAGMHAWIQANKPLFALYFNSEGSLGDHRLTTGTAPAAAAAYQALFGTAAAPTDLPADVAAADGDPIPAAGTTTAATAAPTTGSTTGSTTSTAPPVVATAAQLLSAPAAQVLALVGGTAGAATVPGTAADEVIACAAPRVATTTTTTTTTLNGKVVSRTVAKRTAKATGKGVKRHVTKVKDVRKGSARVRVTISSRLAGCAAVVTQVTTTSKVAPKKSTASHKKPSITRRKTVAPSGRL